MEHPADNRKEIPEIDLSKDIPSFWENHEMPFGIKNLESRYVYSNFHALLNMRPHSMEGLFDREIPHPVAEFADDFVAHDRMVVTRQARVSEVHTDEYYTPNRQLQPYRWDKFPFYQKTEDGKKRCVGIVGFGRKLEICSLNQYLAGRLGSFAIGKPEDPRFTSRHYDVIFFLLQRMSCKEIARRLSLAHYTVENYKREIYLRANVNCFADFKDFCEENAFDRYIPEEFLFRNHRLLDSDADL